MDKNSEYIFKISKVPVNEKMFKNHIKIKLKERIDSFLSEFAKRLNMIKWLKAKDQPIVFPLFYNIVIYAPDNDNIFYKNSHEYLDLEELRKYMLKLPNLSGLNNNWSLINEKYVSDFFDCLYTLVSNKKIIKGLAYCSNDKYYFKNSYQSNSSESKDIAYIFQKELPSKYNCFTYAFQNNIDLFVDHTCFYDSVSYNNQDLFLNEINNVLINIKPYVLSGKIKIIKHSSSNKGFSIIAEEEFKKEIDFLFDELIEKGEVSFLNIPLLKLNDVINNINDPQNPLISTFLNRDFYRANMTEYDIKQIEDPNRGSWELFEDVQNNSGYSFDIDLPIYARNPKADIDENGIIGIDFGTKSTVVVHLTDDSRILPLRIGSGRFEKAPSAEDYENPTVIHFDNIQQFLSDYQSCKGRPMTNWKDITVSHAAFDNWKENENTDRYASFFNELKQWAGSTNERSRIRDNNNFEIDLPAYQNLKESDLDPIELYAYYIGLYINNQNTGKIYLKYLLSFPVTYDLSVRNRILESFRKGILHSLPQTIIEDAECMEKFSVTEGVGEPAAYAVCALQEYGICPEDDKKIMYGIFDFGGGTSDFDFGIWRKPSDKKEKRRYHYIIHHFGSGGDKYLGGENLLNDMAFKVFCDNKDKLREDKITFSRPLDPRYKEFAGSEFLIKNSQEAFSNMHQLSEKLRPLWEESEESESLYNDGVLKLRLFDINGQAHENYELSIDKDSLKQLLTDRIQDGVNEFFNALKAVCYDNEKTGTFISCKGAQQIHIFLAGNSSKSKILQDIFTRKISEETLEFKKFLYQTQNGDEIQGLENEDFDNIEIFKLYYPLGTPEADSMIKRNTGDFLERPTGKTGVAIGLVECRRGSKIKVIDEGEEIKFKFTIGEEDDNGFFLKFLSRNTPYGKWIEYYDAGEPDFEFYYSTLPSAEIEGQLKVSDAKLLRRSFPNKYVDEDSSIFIRPISPNEIEYVVAESQEKVNAGQYVFEPIKINLEEGK